MPAIRLRFLQVQFSKAAKNSGSPENGPPEVHTDFAELENGSLVEVVEDPAIRITRCSQLFRRGRIRLAGQIEDRGRILVPIPRSTLGFFDVKLPRGVMSYKPLSGWCTPS